MCHLIHEGGTLACGSQFIPTLLPWNYGLNAARIVRNRANSRKFGNYARFNARSVFVLETMPVGGQNQSNLWDRTKSTTDRLGIREKFATY